MIDFPDHPDPKLQKRFPTNDVFFRYHSMKAKLRFHHPDWHDTLRQSYKLQEEIAIEWLEMDLYTTGEWAELRARLLQGRRWYLTSASASHLFKGRGTARLIWRDGLGRERRERSVKPRSQSNPCVMEARNEVPPMTACSDEDDEGRPLPSTQPVFGTIKHVYRDRCEPKRTIFVRTPSHTSFKPYEIADACRSKAGSVQQNVCEDAQITAPGVCIVRLRRENLARRLVGQYIRVKDDEMEVLPYPAHRPQIFVAHVRHNDANGIRLDSLLLNTAKAVDLPFYAWTHFVEDEQVSICVIAFERPLKLLCFDIDVQTVGGLHVLAYFNPAARKGSCPVCRGSEHSILQCGLLEEVNSSEARDALKDGKYLYDAPEIV